MRILPPLPLVLPPLCLGALAGTAGAQLHFENVAPATGTVDNSLGRASAWVDLDGDGLLDLVNANVNMPVSFFRHRPDHTFEEATAIWGVPQDDLRHWVPLTADFDGDGDSDIYIASGGRSSIEPNQLLRNDIDQTTHVGVLTDVTATAGDAGLLGTSHGASALDYDLDGDLDVVVTGAGAWTNQLLRNEGGLVFLDVTVPSGVYGVGNHRASGTGDIDNDGWPDIGIAGFQEANKLFHNQQDGTFVDIAASAGVLAATERTFGMIFEDFDNDGWQDLCLPNLKSGPDQPGRIYRNNGDMTYSPIVDLGDYQGMGHNSGDLDADGFAEVYLGTGNPNQAELDILWKITSTGPGQLSGEDVSVSTGVQVEGPTRCHGLAFGDYDQDGDIDVYANNGGPFVPTNQDGFLWRNDGNDNGWVGLDLEGVISNRSAVGTRSVATTSTGREIHLMRSVGKGFGNTDSPTQHFGLGQDGGVQRIDVRWPSGIQQVLLAPATHTRHAMVETGLRFAQPTVAPGGTNDLELCGRPSFACELVASTQIGLGLELLVLGGIVDLMPPMIGFGSFPLDATGRATLPLTVPNAPALSGAQLHFQAWVHGIGTTVDSVLTNVATLKIQ